MIAPGSIDTLSAMVALLKGRPAISELVEGRIYGNDIPKKITDTWSDAASIDPSIVIEDMAGDPAADSPTMEADFVLAIYANSEAAALEIASAIAQDLDDEKGLTAGECLALWAVPAEGAISGLEDETLWPYAAQQWTANFSKSE